MPDQTTTPKPVKPRSARVLDAPGTSGFPNPADDYLEEPLNLHDLVVQNPPATFFVEFTGSAEFAGVRKGDVLVIDRSLSPEKGDLVLCSEEHMSLRLYEEGSSPEVWGVVTHAVHCFRK